MPIRMRHEENSLRPPALTWYPQRLPSTSLVPAHQRLDELATLVVTNPAIAWMPSASLLTFSLNAPPAGMTLDAPPGVLSWTPTEAQGPSPNVIGVQVTDNGSPPMSDIRSFK